MSEPGHIDRRNALHWLEGDERMFLKLITIFKKNMPSQMDQLKAFLAANDTVAAERVAHTIMGSSAMLGASAMSKEAGNIEQSVIGGDSNAARFHFERLVEEYEKVMAELAADGGK